MDGRCQRRGEARGAQTRPAYPEPTAATRAAAQGPAPARRAFGVRSVRFKRRSPRFNGIFLARIPPPD
jgi:hypothetical protein